MGCFLGCLRIKDEGRRRCQLFPKSIYWRKGEMAEPRNHYAAVVSSEEKRRFPGNTGREILQCSFHGEETVHEELRQEAQFLKSCAIYETPVEIQKASVSAVSDEACKKINWDQQQSDSSKLLSEIPGTITVQEEQNKGFQNEEHDVKPSKPMVFEETNHSGDDNRSDSAVLDVSPQDENLMQNGLQSPYPTPLCLIQGMQTPGTVYPSRLENLRNGNVRTQFVYPLPDLSKGSIELQRVCEESQLVQSNVLTEKHMSNTCLGDRENMGEMPPASTKDASWWPKTPDARDGTGMKMDVKQQLTHSDSNPDRPIIGASAAYWNQEDLLGISPKQWDGNGIPNSTTNYKEDQKVSWHATPFEVRLEKALSGEKDYSHRKLD
ncbi:hypothetical protein HPP92_013590 [Vanilla planifolia]|uniref:Protein JASON-like n=1 Tax=Vanilla planifolia TaxID=51239 RepID=A0A835QQB9_VANPL|nr:hypothetical protein HPP92_013590 [Vanilla planifolia]